MVLTYRNSQFHNKLNPTPRQENQPMMYTRGLGKAQTPSLKNEYLVVNNLR